MSGRAISGSRSASCRSWIARSLRSWEIYERLIRETAKRGIFAGMHTGSATYAARVIGMGYRFTTIANDSGLMARAAMEAVQSARKVAGEVAS